MKIGKINIYDFIGEGGITASDIAIAFQSLEEQGIKKFEIHINSNGGEVFEGFAIFNEINNRDCDVFINGIAASIASVIALAGKKVFIYPNSFLMIHNPWTFAIGDQNDLKKSADEIEIVRSAIIETYKVKTKKTEKELMALMDETTFFTAEQAKIHHFVDDVINLPETKSYVALYTEIYDDNQNLNSEEKMNKKLLAFLGFTNAELETATDEQIEAKLAEIKAANSLEDSATLAELLAKVTENAKPEGDLLAQLADVKNQLAAVISKSDSDAEALIKEKTETMVDLAIADFKINASQKETYLLAAQTDFDKVKAELEAIPKNTVKNNLNLKKPVDRGNAIAIANEIVAYRQKVFKDTGKEISFSEAKAAVLPTA